jgi:hypothetical protein
MNRFTRKNPGACYRRAGVRMKNLLNAVRFVPAAPPGGALTHLAVARGTRLHGRAENFPGGRDPGLK